MRIPWDFDGHSVPKFRHGPDSIHIDGPHFKGSTQYLSKDGHNPEAPWPGYGWPLGSECWFFKLTGELIRVATGSTVEKAWARAIEIAEGAT